MSHTPALQMVTGLVCGPYQVLHQVQDGPTLQSRLYLCRSLCCHEEVERSERALRVNLKEGRTLCQRCTNRSTGEERRVIGPGHRFGPVVVLKVLRRNPWRRFTVQWDCCGAVAYLTGAYCYQLENEVRAGRVPICPECKAKQPRARITKPSSEVSWASVFAGMKRP